MGNGFPVFINKVSRFYQVRKAICEFIHDVDQISHNELNIFREKNLFLVCEGFFFILLAAIKFLIDQKLEMHFDLFDISCIFETA